jgi:hypothetical protein
MSPASYVTCDSGRTYVAITANMIEGDSTSLVADRVATQTLWQAGDSGGSPCLVLSGASATGQRQWIHIDPGGVGLAQDSDC